MDELTGGSKGHHTALIIGAVIVVAVLAYLSAQKGATTAPAADTEAGGVGGQPTVDPGAAAIDEAQIGANSQDVSTLANLIAASQSTAASLAANTSATGAALQSSLAQTQAQQNVSLAAIEAAQEATDEQTAAGVTVAQTQSAAQVQAAQITAQTQSALIASQTATANLQAATAQATIAAQRQSTTDSTIAKIEGGLAAVAAVFAL